MVLFVINRDLSLWASHNIFQSNFPTKLIIISSLVLQEKKKTLICGTSYFVPCIVG